MDRTAVRDSAGADASVALIGIVAAKSANVSRPAFGDGGPQNVKRRVHRKLPTSRFSDGSPSLSIVIAVIVPAMRSPSYSPSKSSVLGAIHRPRSSSLPAHLSESEARSAPEVVSSPGARSHAPWQHGWYGTSTRSSTNLMRRGK
eukprot:scaffold71631_cov35-Tisochrysis_lutea.AAC.1